MQEWKATLHSIDGLSRTVSIAHLVPMIRTDFGGVQRKYILKGTSFGTAEYRELNEESDKLRAASERRKLLEARIANQSGSLTTMFEMKENYRCIADDLALDLEELGDESDKLEEENAKLLVALKWYQNRHHSMRKELDRYFNMFGHL